MQIPTQIPTQMVHSITETPKMLPVFIITDWHSQPLGEPLASGALHVTCATHSAPVSPGFMALSLHVNCLSV